MIKNQQSAAVEPEEPVRVPRRRNAGIARFIVLGIFLFTAVALLGIFGPDRLGEPIFLAILGVFASVGVFFLFSLALGMVQLSERKASTDLTELVSESFDEGIVVTDESNRVVYANPAYASLLGVQSTAEVSNIETAFSRKPEAAELIYKLGNEVRAGKPVVEDFRVATGFHGDDGAPRWYRLRAKKASLDGSAKSYLYWQIADVTADRREQENAFQSLQEAIHYLDHAPAGFMSNDENGSLVYVNATLADWLGLDLAMFEPGTLNIRQVLSPESHVLFKSADAAKSAAKTSVLDVDMIRLDGKLLPVRLYSRSEYSTDSSSGSLRTLVLNRSAEPGVDDALRDAEIRFARFFNNTPIAIAGLAEDGTIVRTNAPFHQMFASIEERQENKAIDRFELLVSEQDRELLREPFQRALNGESKIKPVDVPLGGNDERVIRFYFNQVAQAAGNEPANPETMREQVIVYATEITEQRALENQFAKGQKMQAVGQLAGGIAHDFNNVLTAIIGFSDLLLGNHKPTDPSFRDIMNIKQNANRAASLVRQLLAFSRRQTLRPQVLHMPDVLTDLRMLLDRLVGDTVNLDIKHGRDLWPVRADLSQLEQVIVNLVVNARDAMEGDGELKIRTSNIEQSECSRRFDHAELKPADYVLIEVEDNGCGMSREVMDKIFDPFFSTKEVGKGTGLGLSTVYGIVKQTEGFIFAESEVGSGTTFLVFLPRHVARSQDEEEAVVINEKKDEPKRDLTGSATILLVEDEDAVRAFGSRALSARGYEVHEAASGVEALEVMEEYGDEIDLVVSDVVMPEMDGPTLLRELRKTHPDLKFIFVSGYAEEAFAKNLPDEEREKFGFLPKPFSLKQLATTVKEMLDE